MLRSSYFGAVAGFILSLGAFIASFVLPTPEFGNGPLLAAGALAGIWIVLRLPLPRPGANASMWNWAAAGISAAVPFLLYFIHGITDNAAFIGQFGILNLLLTLAVYLAAVTLPLLLLSTISGIRAEIETTKGMATALAAAAIASYLHQQALPEVSPAILTIVTSLLTAGLPLLKPSTIETASAGKNEQIPAKKPARKKESRFTIPGVLIQNTVAVIGLLLLALSTGLLIDKAQLFLLSNEALFSWLLPGILLSGGAGLMISRRVTSERKDLVFAIVLGVCALSLAVGVYLWNTSIFSELYIAYYNNTGFAALHFQYFALVALLPSGCIGALLGMRNSNNRTSEPRWMKWVVFSLIAIVFIWFAAVPLSALLTLQTVVSITAIALALPAAWLIFALPNLSKLVRFITSIAVVFIVVYPLFATTEPEFENLFDPSSYQIVGQDTTKGGMTTLLKARNYDDPFTTLFWNQSTALTQSSRDVRADMERIIHLPMLLHENPGRVLMLGMGSFEKYRTFELYNPALITIVESNPSVVRLYNAWMRANKKKIEKPYTFRSERLPAFLARNNERFDVVISGEPFADPYRTTACFSEEYYSNASRSLADGGIFVQWLPLLELEPGALGAIHAAMAKAFPHINVWTGTLNPNSGMIAVTGSQKEIRFTERTRKTLAKISETPANAFALLTTGLPSWEYLAAEYAGDGKILDAVEVRQTPVSPLSAQRLYRGAVAGPQTSDMFELVLKNRSFSRSLVAGVPDSTVTMIQTLFETRPDIYRDAKILQDRIDTVAIRSLITIIQQHPYSLDAKYTLAGALLKQAAEMVANKNYRAAMPGLLQASGIAPLNTYVLRLMMICAYELGDNETARTCLNGIKRLDPKHAGSKDNQATIKAQQGLVEDALILYENAITLDPKNEEFYCNMAALQFNIGRSWEAVRILDNAIDQSYYPSKPYMLKAMVYEQGGKSDLAIEAYKKCLSISKPNDPNRQAVAEKLNALESNKQQKS